jgi:hypothetical protein
LNHVQGSTINPQRVIAAYANTLILLPLQGSADMAGPTAWLDPVANDPNQTLGIEN